MAQTMNKRRGMDKNKLSRNVFIFAMIIVPVLHFFVFYLYVNFNSIMMGFKYPVNGEETWSLRNFTWFFSEFNEGALNPAKANANNIVYALMNTLKTFGVNLIMFPIGFLTSYFIYKKVPGWWLYRVLFFLPMIIPAFVFTYAYQTMLMNGSPIVALLQDIHGWSYEPSILSEVEHANNAVLFFVIWQTIPGNLLLWSGSLSRVPDSVVESARLDGVNWVQEAIHIIIPVIWPTFAMQFLFLFIGLFGASGPVLLLTNGANGTQTLSNWLYQQILMAGGNEASVAFNRVSAVGILMTVVTLPICLGIRAIQGKFFKDVEY
jgi:ABC-type sugar transport system permease subunit